MAYTSDLIPDMTSNTEPSGVASASDDLGGGYPAYRAFDDYNVGDAGNGWACSGTSGWVQYQFTSSHVITQYTVTNRDAGALSRSPKSWTFKGSNNGTDWTTLDTQSNITDWASTTIKHTYPITNSTAYSYYRMNITESNDASYVGVGEIEAMETISPSSSVSLSPSTTPSLSPSI